MSVACGQRPSRFGWNTHESVFWFFASFQDVACDQQLSHPPTQSNVSGLSRSSQNAVLDGKLERLSGSDVRLASEVHCRRTQQSFCRFLLLFCCVFFQTKMRHFSLSAAVGFCALLFVIAGQCSHAQPSPVHADGLAKMARVRSRFPSFGGFDAQSMHFRSAHSASSHGSGSPHYLRSATTSRKSPRSVCRVLSYFSLLCRLQLWFAKPLMF